MAQLTIRLSWWLFLMKRAFVVLGMHRSGTSSVAGLLAQLGATPPKTLMAAKPENPKGFWESEVIMAFNDEILTRAQSSWDDPKPLQTDIFEGEQGASLRQRAGEKLTEEFGDADTIVLKDPRICRFYPFWEQVLTDKGYTPYPILPIRAPAEVAASLHGRNGMPVSEALALWKRHVADAEQSTRDTPRHIMMWTDLLADWRKALGALETSLGYDPVAAASARVDEFVDPSLSRHLGRDLAPPDPDSTALFERMKSLSKSQA